MHVIAEICDYMLELGWGPYQNDHEDANGQFEMNWEFDDVLATADKHSFFKLMTKSVAEKTWIKGNIHAKTSRRFDRKWVSCTYFCLGCSGRRNLRRMYLRIQKKT